MLKVLCDPYQKTAGYTVFTCLQKQAGEIKPQTYLIFRQYDQKNVTKAARKHNLDYIRGTIKVIDKGSFTIQRNTSDLLDGFLELNPEYKEEGTECR